jgi:3-deoxy-D-arabino-heptulosonate 7-phosphate (DAHP) synthase class II
VRELAEALDEIQNRPPLVFAGEARSLQAQLANAAAGNAFVLFGGTRGFHSSTTQLKLIRVFH